MNREPQLETRQGQPLDISDEFTSMDYSGFRAFLRRKLKENPSATFLVAMDWVDKQTARKAKACLDDRALGIKSITIRATRKQFEEDVNAFGSGVKWEEI